LTAASAPTVLYRSSFDLDTLSQVRRAAVLCLSTHGLPSRQTDDISLAIAEVLANAIEHGGGSGDIAVMYEDRRLHCVITDYGPGFRKDPYRRRLRRPDPLALHGRGLWLTFTLCPTVTVTSSTRGTRVNLIIDLPEPRLL
jgi:anti-sigma regulatory factor (Ser/Thr protein kinase)